MCPDMLHRHRMLHMLPCSSRKRASRFGCGTTLTTSYPNRSASASGRISALLRCSQHCAATARPAFCSSSYIVTNTASPSAHLSMNQSDKKRSHLSNSRFTTSSPFLSFACAKNSKTTLLHPLFPFQIHPFFTPFRQAVIILGAP